MLHFEISLFNSKPNFDSSDITTLASSTANIDSSYRVGPTTDLACGLVVTVRGGIGGSSYKPICIVNINDLCSVTLSGFVQTNESA